MTTKERNLASILGGVLGVLLAGVVGYLFVLSPYLEVADQADKRKLEVAELETKAAKIELDKRLFEFSRRQSLPADAKVSRGQYATFLETLGRKADISPASMKVVSADPDEKSGMIPGTKKSAYKKLAYTVTLRADLYRVTDLLHHFYQQPLLHAIKSINVQKPSDTLAQRNKELDVTLAIEALVLEGALDRPSLLPVAPAAALMSGAAIQTVYNWGAVTSGAGTPVPAAGVLAEPRRQYLSIAGRNPFYGPPPKKEVREVGPQREDDSSPYITLIALTGHPEDGTHSAIFWDKLTNNEFLVTQSATGAISVLGEFKLQDRDNPREWKKLPLTGYSKYKTTPNIMYGTAEGQNQRAWRVRRVTDTEVFLEKLSVDDEDDTPAKPKATPAAVFGGGPGAFVAIPEKVYRVALGGSLDGRPVENMLQRELWRKIYARAKPPVSAAPMAPVSQEAPRTNAVTADRDR